IFEATEHQWQELLEYMAVHVNDASESSKPSWGKTCTLSNSHQHYPGERKVHFRVLIDSGATVSTSLKGIKCVLQVLDDSSTKFCYALQMSMLEDRLSYINVSESAQDTDVRLRGS
ncbi:hypothetical protein Tco_1207551, partial [Tanacetum coccineum]